MISSLLLLLVSAALAQETMTSSAPELVLGYPTQLDITSKAQPCELQVTRTGGHTAQSNGSNHLSFYYYYYCSA